MEDFISACQSSGQTLTNLHSLPDAIAILSDFAALPEKVSEEIGKLEKHVAAIPEATKQDAAREFLTIAQERLEVWREAKRKEHTGRTKATQAKVLSDSYVKVSDELLGGLYAEVEKDFSRLTPQSIGMTKKHFGKTYPFNGKLGFNVDFYGRGVFPPGAYHSEGHQDGMGLCLYLALMRHLQKDGFTFAVLDDVLMSVDTGQPSLIEKPVRFHPRLRTRVLASFSKYWQVVANCWNARRFTDSGHSARRNSLMHMHQNLEARVGIGLSSLASSQLCCLFGGAAGLI